MHASLRGLLLALSSHNAASCVGDSQESGTEQRGDRGMLGSAEGSRQYGVRHGPVSVPELPNACVLNFAAL